jgi:beta-glucanase (GH16 family)
MDSSRNHTTVSRGLWLAGRCGALACLLAAGPVAAPALAAHSSESKAKASTAVKTSVQADPTCGGEVPSPKPDGTAWTCTFDDEFDASTGDASSLNTGWWSPQLSATSGYTTGPWGDWVCYVNSPNNISVSNGALHLTIRKEASAFWCGAVPTQYTGGMVSTYQHFAQTYGRFEVRAQLPQTTVAGLQETLWLWPANDTAYGAAWPDSGEVDFSEFYSEYSGLDVPYIHYNYSAATVNPLTDTNEVTGYCPIDLAAYNDYAVTWSPGQFVITINGITCMVDNYQADDGLTGAAPFDQPFFIALTQALGVGTNAFDPATTPLPATTSVQYVRVWK